jgi:hypothetical protein
MGRKNALLFSPFTTPDFTLGRTLHKLTSQLCLQAVLEPCKQLQNTVCFLPSGRQCSVIHIIESSLHPLPLPSPSPFRSSISFCPAPWPDLLAWL